MNPRIATRDIALVGLLSAVLFGSQIALSSLPNIETVSLLVILYSLHFRRLAPYIIYVFVLLEGVAYGFHLWWISYLYVWMILYMITRFFCHNKSPLFWALVSGAFGLGFGALCVIPYLLVDIRLAGAKFIAGIPFDIVHCVGNFVLMLLFYRPLGKILSRAG